MTLRHVYVCSACREENAFVEPKSVRTRTEESWDRGRIECEERVYTCSHCASESRFDLPLRLWREAAERTLEDLEEGAPAGVTVILNAVDLRILPHTRPAAAFVEEARRHAADVRLARLGAPFEADGKSLLDVLVIGAMQGSGVRLRCIGEDAEEAMGHLLAVLCGHSS